MAKIDDIDFGPVMITGGKHKGTIGFYDDTNGRSALVFLGPPFVSPCVWMRFAWIEPLTNVSSLEIEAFRRANPVACKLLGV